MTKDEKNRKIAEWLEPHPAWDRSCRGLSPLGAWERRRLREWRDGMPKGYWDDRPSDFFTDEAANALILEKAKDLCLEPMIEHSGGTWNVLFGVGPDVPEIKNADRKTAVCEAALKLIEKP